MGARWLTEEQVEAFQRRTAERSRTPALPRIAAAVKVAKRASRSELEAELHRQVEAAGMTGYEFDCPYLIGTRHRADVLFRDARLVVEVQGGCHVIRAKAHADIRKAAESLLQGWRLLPVDKDAIYSGQALTWITQLLKG